MRPGKRRRRRPGSPEVHSSEDEGDGRPSKSTRRSDNPSVRSSASKTAAESDSGSADENDLQFFVDHNHPRSTPSPDRGLYRKRWDKVHQKYFDDLPFDDAESEFQQRVSEWRFGPPGGRFPAGEDLAVRGAVSGDPDDGDQPPSEDDMDRAESTSGGAVGDAQVGQQFKRGRIEDLLHAHRHGHHGGRKHKRAEGAGSAMDTDAVEESGGRGGGGTITPIPPVTRSSIDTASFERTFRNKWIMKTWAFAGMTKEEEGEGQQKKGSMRSTSLCYLPLMHLKFYLSKIQYERLITPSRVVEVGVRVVPLGNSVCFDTNQVGPGSATSEHVVFYASGVGVNRFMPSYPVKVTPDKSVPMRPAKIEPYVSDTGNLFGPFFEKMWGSSDSEHLDKSFVGVDCAIRHWNSYLAYGNPVFTPGGHYRLDQVIDVMPANAVEGTPIVDWKYEPQAGWIKVDTPDTYLTQDKACVYGVSPYINANPVALVDRVKHATTGNISSVRGSIGASLALNKPEFEDWDTIAIEQADLIKLNSNAGGLFHFNEGFPVFGTLPIQSNSPGDSNSSWVNCNTLWQVETYCKIRCGLPTDKHTVMYIGSLKSLAQYHLGPSNDNGAAICADRFYLPQYYNLGVVPKGGSQVSKKYKKDGSFE